MLFVVIGRNAQVPTQFVHLPPNRVVEVGMPVEI
jgi:K+ transporter